MFFSHLFPLPFNTYINTWNRNFPPGENVVYKTILYYNNNTKSHKLHIQNIYLYLYVEVYIIYAFMFWQSDNNLIVHGWSWTYAISDHKPYITDVGTWPYIHL